MLRFSKILLGLMNLLAEAEQRLVASGVRSSEASQLFRPGERPLQLRGLCRHQSDGLPIFVSPAVSRPYRVALELQELVGRRPPVPRQASPAAEERRVLHFGSEP